VRNSPWLPGAALTVAVILAIVTTLLARNDPGPLTELQIGAVAAILGLGIFGIQGILSVVVEGEELHPGRSPARLTEGLSLAITLLCILLLIAAAVLVLGVASDWSTQILGLMAGAGSIAGALLLVFYKEAFIGDEALFDDRDDGIPW